MNFTNKKLIHFFIFALLVGSVPIFYSCESNNQLVNPFETAKIEIQLVMPESLENAGQTSQVKDCNSSLIKRQVAAISEVTVSVLDSATQNVVINQQSLTISGSSASGELNVPVTGARQTFIIIVFASDPVQLLFFVGNETIQLESGEMRESPVVIILGEPNLIASQGEVQASSSFSEANFAPELAVDFDFSTSWFSAGTSVDGDTSTFTWTSAHDEFIASAGIVNNSNHFSLLLRNGLGFNTVTFQVFSGPNATGNRLFEETVNYPTSSQLPVSTVAPLVEGRSIRLLLNEPQDESRGGFSELLIVGMSFVFYEPPILQSITVTPADTSIVIGRTVQFNALGNYSDGPSGNISNQVTWSSNNATVATISSTGLATANSPGNTTIKAELSGVSGQTGLTVSAAPLLSINVTPADTTIVVGDNLQFTATGNFSDNSTSDITGEVTWASNNTDVASINTTGIATANSAGNTTISAEKDGITGNTNLTVSQLTGATISNFTQQLVSINSCTLQDSITGSIFELNFNYIDPNGDVTEGTIINYSFVFSPSAFSGTSSFVPAEITGDGFSGTVKLFLCIAFSNDTSIENTVSITDAGGSTSNSISIIIPKPDGAGSPQLSNIKGDSSKHLIPNAGVCKEP